MKREPPKPPNPVVQKIEETKTLKTNDDVRLRPQERSPSPGIAPSGSVGTERTQRQEDAAAHNAKIEKSRREQEAARKAREVPGGLADEFNQKSKKL